MHGPSTLEPIMDIVRRQVEACDSLGGFFLMQSLAGGTGSGVGIVFFFSLTCTTKLIHTNCAARIYFVMN